MNHMPLSSDEKQKSFLRVPFDILDVFMPLGVIADAEGMIIHIGPTLAKFEKGRPFIGQNLFEVFVFQRPHGVNDFPTLIEQGCKQLKAHLHNGAVTGLRGVAVALPGKQGVLLNFGLGVKLSSTVSEYRLKANDFAAADGTSDMLYMFELQTMLLAESVNLNTRLQGATRAADDAAGKDPLTGLYNRRGLHGYLGRLKRRAEDIPHAFVQIDLDYFKVVNDTHGHAAGDAVLKHVSRIMRDSTRPDDIVARTGGDEFVLVLRHMNSGQNLTRMCERLISKISEPISVTGVKMGVGASIGAVFFNPSEGVDEHTLMRTSDEFLYSSKENGRGRVSVMQFEHDDAIPSP
jgi:diguanylate cyclase (GGDEF)-like protein